MAVLLVRAMPDIARWGSRTQIWNPIQWKSLAINTGGGHCVSCRSTPEWELTA